MRRATQGGQETVVARGEHSQGMGEYLSRRNHDRHHSMRMQRNSHTRLHSIDRLIEPRSPFGKKPPLFSPGLSIILCTLRLYIANKLFVRLTKPLRILLAPITKENNPPPRFMAWVAIQLLAIQIREKDFRVPFILGDPFLRNLFPQGETKSKDAGSLERDPSIFHDPFCPVAHSRFRTERWRDSPGRMHSIYSALSSQSQRGRTSPNRTVLQRYRARRPPFTLNRSPDIKSGFNKSIQGNFAGITLSQRVRGDESRLTRLIQQLVNA